VGALLSPCESRGESIRIVSPVWLTVRDGGVARDQLLSYSMRRGLVSSLSSIPGEILVAISLMMLLQAVRGM